MSLASDILHLQAAARMARDFSKDPSTQNGSILIGAGGGTLAFGYNHIHELHDRPERWERPLKYSYIEHAETHCIHQCAKNGLATRDATLYVVWYACDNCAKAIIQAGIRRVVGSATALFAGREHPNWSANVQLALEMLKEAGVQCDWLSDPLNVKIRMNYKEVEL